MTGQRAYDLIEKIPDAVCRRDVPCATLCTFRTGGTAEFVAEPGNASALKRILEICADTGVRYFILGNGSNLLFSDLGFDGVIVRTSRMKRVTGEGTTVRAGCGALLSAVSSKARAWSLTGLEFAEGIPGTLGGGIFMNAGAYGGELSSVVKSVSALDTVTLEIREYGPAECGFGYRASRFQGGGEVILSAELALEKGDGEKIGGEMARLRTMRREKQPLRYPSAGSAFKRPAGDYAARLIDSCGLKGFSSGGAAVSEKHAGFVINKGGAESADVIAVMRAVRTAVFEKTGVLLEPEIRYIAHGSEVIPDIFSGGQE
ncbi:MAG: UDP-N-acetylmuramate dehydrogenase [Clostridia bacterium]|nr:UDP-N-acetylmuramate dehydrogenase [Clostridia bacterium]